MYKKGEAPVVRLRNEGMSGGVKGLLWVIGGLIVIVLLWYAVAWIIDNTPGMTTSNPGTPIQQDSFIGRTINIVLGIDNSKLTIEMTIIHIAIFLILMFAIADILMFASTFNETTSWIIGFALALVASVSKIVALIAGFIGVAAGLSAIGIGVIIVASVFSMVILNLGVGGALRKWRWKRQAEIDESRSAKGASSAVNAIRGLKAIDEEFKAGEKA